MITCGRLSHGGNKQANEQTQKKVNRRRTLLLSPILIWRIEITFEHTLVAQA